MGRTYGWTPRQILSELDLEQVATLHRYALEMDGLIPRTIDDGPDADAFGRRGDDGPDVEAIEALFGDRIKRGVTDDR